MPEKSQWDARRRATRVSLLARPGFFVAGIFLTVSYLVEDGTPSTNPLVSRASQLQWICGVAVGKVGSYASRKNATGWCAMSTSRDPSPFHALLDGLNRSRPPNERAVSEHRKVHFLELVSCCCDECRELVEKFRQVRTKTNPTPMDVIFILFASVALVVLILSFSPVRGAEPFQKHP